VTNDLASASHTFMCIHPWREKEKEREKEREREGERERESERERERVQVTYSCIHPCIHTCDTIHSYVTEVNVTKENVSNKRPSERK